MERTMQIIRRLIAVLLLTIGCGAVPAMAYDEIAVTNGATLIGTITLDGVVPQSKQSIIHGSG